MNDNQDNLNLLRKISNKPKSSQRELAEELGFSLGKLNYCLKALKSKGLIKIKNFKRHVFSLRTCFFKKTKISVKAISLYKNVCILLKNI